MKAGLNRAIQSFALDLAPYGIRINNVAPGAIRVRSNEEMARAVPNAKINFWDELGPDIPLERSGLPEDIGGAAAFLASDDASYITGVTLRVDGGLILAGMPEIKEADGPRWGGRPAQWKP
jgi:NAD(P)-dependent dehydrogenase (short-subunit alcohol dehydrogenase family)